jgi:Transposase DDE domain
MPIFQLIPGGRTTKIHALTDRFCRPLAFLLTGGQVADCVAADVLLDRMATAEILHGDKGYDSDAVCQCRSNFPHLCRSKIPQAVVCLDQPAG